MSHHLLLDETEGSPVAVVNPQARGQVVLVCEHASAAIPKSLGGLGLAPEVRDSHAAWDPGALAVALDLSAELDAVLFHQRFSRLVYDCNRPPEAPSAIPTQSEIYAIPGNADLSEADRQARVAGIYLPFRDGLAELLAGRKAAGRASVLVTIHSFNPVWFGQPRAVELGILHDGDSRLADAMLERAARNDGGYVTRRNEPYGPADGVTHTLIEHGLANGLPNVMIEWRNDLLRDEAGRRRAGAYLADLIRAGLARL